MLMFSFFFSFAKPCGLAVGLFVECFAMAFLFDSVTRKSQYHTFLFLLESLIGQAFKHYFNSLDGLDYVFFHHLVEGVDFFCYIPLSSSITGNLPLTNTIKQANKNIGICFLCICIVTDFIINPLCLWNITTRSTRTLRAG